MGLSFLMELSVNLLNLRFYPQVLVSAKPPLPYLRGNFIRSKKMFLSVGVKVTALKRVQFGDFILDPELAKGDFRLLNKEEIAGY